MIEPTATPRAIASWIGTLTAGGLITRVEEEAGVTLACYVVGESRLSDLREWCATLEPEAIRVARLAAIETLIWLAHADRRLAPEEATMLGEIIACSGLSQQDRTAMTKAIESPPKVGTLAVRIGHPVLAEILIALGWELADADGDVSRSEQTFLGELARKLAIPPERATELRELLLAQVSAL